MDEAFSDMLRQAMLLGALHCRAPLLAPRRPRRSTEEVEDIMVELRMMSASVGVLLCIMSSSSDKGIYLCDISNILKTILPVDNQCFI